MTSICKCQQKPLLTFHILSLLAITAIAKSSNTHRGTGFPPSWRPSFPRGIPPHNDHHNFPWIGHPDPYTSDLFRHRYSTPSMFPSKTHPAKEFTVTEIPLTYGHKDFSYDNHLSRFGPLFPASNQSSPNTRRASTILSGPVTHNYFSLGDNRKWWLKKESGKSISTSLGVKSTDSTTVGSTLTNVFGRPGRPRPRNYAAFVLGSPQRYSTKQEKEVPTTDISSEGRTDPLVSRDAASPMLRKTKKKTTQSSASKKNNSGEESEHSDFLKKEKYLKKHKNLNLDKAFSTAKIERSKKVNENLNIGILGRRSSVPHPGFYKHYTPDCAFQSNRSYCLLDETYPREFMMKQLMSHQNLLEKLWRPYSPALLNTSEASGDYFASHAQRDLHIPKYPQRARDASGGIKGREGYSCSSQVERKMLSQAKNTRGEWKMIVNVKRDSEDDVHLLQATSLEECTATGNSCDFLPKGLATSRCIQRFTTHNLLTWEPRRGFYVDSYQLPTACVCYISHINVSFIKSYVG